ncbi:MAG: hypothetical protein ABUL63_04920, partial [Acidobacteriota bacterium]
MSQAAQACGALVLALVLVGFHRHYRREYLRTWAWSWWAFCAWMGTSSLALFLAADGTPLPGLQMSLAVLALISGYWHVAWL